MFSDTDWMSDWHQAEAFSLLIGAISSTIPLRGLWEPNDRIALAMASFRLAQVHHSSIHLLFSNDKGASANALIRPLLEAGFRTIWIAEDASVQELNNLAQDRGKLPLLARLNECFSKRSEKPLSGQLQRLLHSLTHGGTRALAAQSLDGEKLIQSSAVMVAMAGLALGGAGYAASKFIGRQDLLERLALAVPIVD